MMWYGTTYLHFKVSGGVTATNGTTPTAADPGRMSKDSILALFGSRPAASPALFGPLPTTALPQAPLPGSVVDPEDPHHCSGSVWVVMDLDPLCVFSYHRTVQQIILTKKI